MSEQANVVGILQTHEILVIIEGLEKVEREAQEAKSVLEKADTFNDEWEKWQGVLVSARHALATFRAIVSPPTPGMNSVWTIRWEGSLKKALAAMGQTLKPEIQEKEQRSEYDE